jgi:serine/threonine protein kinase
MSSSSWTIAAGDGSTRTESSVNDDRCGEAAREAGSRSCVIEAAVGDFFQLAQAKPSLSAEEFCRARELGSSSLQSSVIRQIELERFVLRHSLAPRSEAIRWPVPGEQVGPFHILEEVGRGGLARVYLCIQDNLGSRQVIIKLAQSADTEAHSLGKLSHPNIVPIFSAHHDDAIDLDVLCMPYLGRSTLCDLLDIAFEKSADRTGNLLAKASRRWGADLSDESRADLTSFPFKATYEECIAYIGQCLASALQHAHSEKILHGDIKPSNVLLSRSGVPLLMDFNLSANAALSLGARGGTIPYMPPEQLLAFDEIGSGKVKYDARSDLFSLGAVLYELLTGRLPFPVESISDGGSMLARRLRESQQAGCAPLTRIAPSVPAGLAAAVERCLRFDPDERPQSAEELLASLSAVIRPSARWRRRIAQRRVWLPMAATALIVAAIGGTYAVTRSPAHIRAFRSGLELSLLGDNVGAINEFQDAASLSPSFRPARLELGRALLADRQYAEARTHFAWLAKDPNDAVGKAYVAYCFALEGKLTESIPWNLASLNLAETPQVHNNLAVGYELGGSTLAAEDRRTAIADHLTKARLELPTSPTVLLNCVLYDLSDPLSTGARLTADLVGQARSLADAFPASGLANICAAKAISLTAETDPRLHLDLLAYLLRAIELGQGPSRDEFSRLPSWRFLRESESRAVVLKAMADAQGDRSAAPPEIPRLLPPEVTRSVADGIAE